MRQELVSRTVDANNRFSLDWMLPSTRAGEKFLPNLSEAKDLDRILPAREIGNETENVSPLSTLIISDATAL